MRVSTLTRCGSLLAAFGLVACTAFNDGAGADGAGGEGPPKEEPTTGSTGSGGQAGSAGGEVALAQAGLADTCGAGDGNVARVPDNGRTMDSALYALRLLRRVANGAGTGPNAPELPVQANIRVNDFVNYYALELPESDPVTVDFRLEANGSAIGTLIARMPAPTAKAFNPRLVVAIDTSISMRPLLDVQDALASALQGASSQFGGEATLRTWTSPTYTIKGDNAVDGANEAAVVVRDVCTTLDPNDQQVTHLVLLGDGRANFDGLAQALVDCPKVKVDAVVVAHAREAGMLADGGSAIEDVGITYNPSALDPVSRLGGASLLVTDAGAELGYPDVAFVTKRFPALFGDALESVRVLVRFPGVIAPLSIESELPTQPVATTLPLAPRTIGFNDVIAFRQLMTVEGVLGDGGCAQATMTADVWFKPVGGTEFESRTVTVQFLDSMGGGLNPLRDYDEAVSRFAQTLRTANPTVTAVFPALTKAFAEFHCDSEQSAACNNIVEMKNLLAPYKPTTTP